LEFSASGSQVKVLVRVEDPNRRIAALVLNPQLSPEESIEDGGHRSIECAISVSGPSAPLLRYKCAAEFRPVLFKCRTGILYDGAQAKVFVEVRAHVKISSSSNYGLQILSNPDMPFPIQSVVCKASLAQLAAVASVESIQCRPEGTHDPASHMVEWFIPGITPGARLRVEGLVSLQSAPESSCAPARVPVIVQGLAMGQLITSSRIFAEMVSDLSGMPVLFEASNPRRTRVHFKFS
jgi:hypothetical protein